MIVRMGLWCWVEGSEKGLVVVGEDAAGGVGMPGMGVVSSCKDRIVMTEELALGGTVLGVVVSDKNDSVVPCDRLMGLKNAVLEV